MALGCLSSCLPVLAPYMATHTDRPRDGVGAALVFSGGRLLGYCLVLGTALALGARLPDASWVRGASAVSLLVLGGLMLAYAVHANIPGARFCKLRGFTELLRRFPAAAGMLVGLSPCPPLLTAAATLAGGHAGQASAFIAAFAVGTAAVTLPLAWLGHPKAPRVVASIARFAAVFIGMWFVARAAALLGSAR